MRTSWWYGGSTDQSIGRVRAVSTPVADRSLFQRWFPTLSGWFRLGAPVSLLDPVSIERLIALATLLTIPMMVILAGLPSPYAAGFCAVAIIAIAMTYRFDGNSPRVALFVQITSFALITAAIALSPGSQRVVLSLIPLAASAFFFGLFTRLARLFAALLLGSAALFGVARFTSDAAGSQNTAAIVCACWLVGAMSAAMAHGSRQAGSIDTDTGLPNVRGLHRSLSKANQPTLVTTVRLAGIGSVRDALGHAAGTELVRCVATQLSRTTTPSMRLGRVSDDELAVLIPMLATRDDAERLALRTVTMAVGDCRYLISNVEVSIEVHLGVAAFSPDDEDADDPIATTQEGTQAQEAPTNSLPSGPRGGDTPRLRLVRDAIRRSSLAARQAMDAGVSIRTWDGLSTTLTADDLDLLADLRSAAERGELWLAYQPQVRTLDRTVASVEALLRWYHPSRGLVQPGHFIPLAERTGMIDRLTDWVVGEALDAQVRWRRSGIELGVSVNVSPLSLRRTDFAGRVSEAIVTRGLPPSSLTVEVTESTAFDVAQAVERLTPLRSLGVRVAIDDFGTGYTSLAILPELAIDEIKLDQRFVKSSAISPASRAIVSAMCELAHQLGLSAVAEGAETADIVELLTDIGYDLIQGYVYSAPLDEANLLAWLPQPAPPEPAPAAALPPPTFAQARY